MKKAGARAVCLLRSRRRTVLLYSLNELLCRYTLVKPEDGEFGRQTGNGTWSGMIGQLVKEVGFQGFYLDDFSFQDILDNVHQIY